MSNQLLLPSKALENWLPENRRRLSPEELFLTIATLEAVIEQGRGRAIFEALYSDEWVKEVISKAQKNVTDLDDKKCSRESYKECLVEMAQVEWSVEFASDKRALLDFGVISAKDGDLRKAQLLPEKKRALNLLRWKTYREQPDLFSKQIFDAIRVGGKEGQSFLRSLSEIVAHLAKPFPQPEQTPLEKCKEFLLHFWAKSGAVTDQKGKPSFPLCWFSDRALFDFLYQTWGENRGSGKNVEALAAVERADERLLRTLWERLGLKRPKTWHIVCHKIDRPKKVLKLFWDLVPTHQR